MIEGHWTWLTLSMKDLHIGTGPQCPCQEVLGASAQSRPLVL